MAPHPPTLRLAELEAAAEKLNLRMSTLTKESDHHADELKELSTAVFGDRNRPDERPGIVHELRALRESVKDVRAAISKVTWLVITGVIAGVLSQLIRH